MKIRTSFILYRSTDFFPEDAYRINEYSEVNAALEKIEADGKRQILSIAPLRGCDLLVVHQELG